MDFAAVSDRIAVNKTYLSLHARIDGFPKPIKRYKNKLYWDAEAIERYALATPNAAQLFAEKAKLIYEQRKHVDLFGENIDPLIMQFIRRPYVNAHANR